MKEVRVYEPALCCNTGVCGPDVDQALVTFTADLNAAKESGADIERFNLASDPVSFAENPVVINFLQAAGSEGLPLVLVDGVTVMTGRYPTRQELQRFIGVRREPLPVVEQASSCCSSTTSTGCC